MNTRKILIRVALVALVACIFLDINSQREKRDPVCNILVAVAIVMIIGSQFVVEGYRGDEHFRGSPIPNGCPTSPPPPSEIVVPATPPPGGYGSDVQKLLKYCEGGRSCSSDGTCPPMPRGYASLTCKCPEGINGACKGSPYAHCYSHDFPKCEYSRSGGWNPECN